MPPCIRQCAFRGGRSDHPAAALSLGASPLVSVNGSARFAETASAITREQSKYPARERFFDRLLIRRRSLARELWRIRLHIPREHRLRLSRRGHTGFAGVTPDRRVSGRVSTRIANAAGEGEELSVAELRRRSIRHPHQPSGIDDHSGLEPNRPLEEVHLTAPDEIRAAMRDENPLQWPDGHAIRHLGSAESQDFAGHGDKLAWAQGDPASIRHFDHARRRHAAAVSEFHWRRNLTRSPVACEPGGTVRNKKSVTRLWCPRRCGPRPCRFGRRLDLRLRHGRRDEQRNSQHEQWNLHIP